MQESLEACLQKRATLMTAGHVDFGDKKKSTGKLVSRSRPRIQYQRGNLCVL